MHPSMRPAPASRRRRRLASALGRPGPVRLIALGYASYMAAGFAVLMLPAAAATDVRWIDHLFIAVSAVSTTGLVSIDPGSSYTLLGQAAILVMIQAGGIGFMTANSVVWMALTDRPPAGMQVQIARSVFALPPEIPVRPFLARVILYTALVEAAGALALWPLFAAAGAPNPAWQALFHSVSAFCTAGFALFPTSFEAFAGNAPLLGVISVLAILGAIGFLVVHEAWERLAGRRAALSVSTRLILAMTALMLALGTLAYGLVEPQVATLAGTARLANAVFQAMSATTTVGFNSVAVGSFAPAGIVVTFMLMLVGASPSGTGGGLKSTTVAVQWAFLWATLRAREHVSLAGVTVPDAKVRQAIATFFMAASMIALAVLVLAIIEPALAFDRLLFEATSALATAGLSLGATAELSDAGKLVVIALMFIGRVGILAFGLLLVDRARGREAAAPLEDVVL